jgi:DNA-binding Xre family transcriptional regulator
VKLNRKLNTGQAIRVIRMHANDGGKIIRQSDIEKAVGLSQGKLSRVEVHNEDIYATKLEAVCKMLNTSMVEFFKIREGL